MYANQLTWQLTTTWLLQGVCDDCDGQGTIIPAGSKCKTCKGKRTTKVCIHKAVFVLYFSVAELRFFFLAIIFIVMFLPNKNIINKHFLQKIQLWCIFSGKESDRNSNWQRLSKWFQKSILRWGKSHFLNTKDCSEEWLNFRWTDGRKPEIGRGSFAPKKNQFFIDKWIYWVFRNT